MVVTEARMEWYYKFMLFTRQTKRETTRTMEVDVRIILKLILHLGLD
jgi:hypothetical protein